MKMVIFSVLMFFTLMLRADEGAHGQGNSNKQIYKGIVTDESGEPLAGVQIRIEGSDAYYYTDFEGRFAIPADQQHAVEFWYAAMLPLKIQSLSVSAPEHPVLNKIQLKSF